MPAGYVANTEGAEALAAATTETVLNVIAATDALLRLVEFGISFDGVTATAVPVFVEFCGSTQAGAGTSSAATIKQIRGPTRTVQATARHSYTVEPTVITAWKPYFVRADGGLLIIQNPLGREPEQIVTVNGLLLRCTAPAAVNVHAYMEFEEG